MRAKNCLHKNIVTITGLLLILVGITFNQWTLAMLFTPDGVLHTQSRFIIWMFDLVLISLGLLNVSGRSFWKVKRFGIILMMLSVGLSAIIGALFPAPYFWISIIWFIAIIYHAVFTNKTSMRAVWINLSFVILTLGIFEGYLYIQKDKERYEGFYLNKYVTSDSVLGAEPLRNAKVISGRRYINNNLVWEASYTIDKNGMRIGPPTNDRTNGECVIFFGGSVTYGTGVNDNETMPYIVGIKSNGKYRTYNFGFGGYGPHQMLAAIEKGYIEKRLNFKPKYAVYQSLRDHVRRVAGLVPYHKNALRYILNQDGNLVLTGRFIDFEKKWERNHIIRSMINLILRKSEILNKTLYERWSYGSFVEKRDIDLFIEIVDKARKIFCNRYTGSKFYVLFWDVDIINWKIEEINKAVLKGLRDKGIRVYLISEILKDYNDNKLKYCISQYDGHPNKIAYQIIAEYVVTKILGQK